MEAQLGKWGDSLGVLIPGKYVKELDLKEGMEIEVTRVDGGIMVRRKTIEYSLDELLGGIKPENIHGETDWGSVAGREAW